MLLCWHCCHDIPTDNTPIIRLPISYDSRRNEFEVAGQFCSWPCMKAYNIDSRRNACSVNQNIVTLFRKRCTGDLTPLRAAPPRELLAAFGGTMTIEDFRAASSGPLDFVPMPPKMIMREIAIAEQAASATHNASVAKIKATHDLHAKVDFAGVEVKNESLRLKRPKKTAPGSSTASGGLARTLMGMTLPLAPASGSS